MTNWHHSPTHIFNSLGSYIITGSTLHKAHFFHKPEYLNFLQNSIFDLALKYEWRLEAWAIFSNHYHFIAQSPSNPSSLQRFLTHLHASTARRINELDNFSGRKVWYQYWDTNLTFQKSYFARLAYVMNNPVKHKLVENAEDYLWCSAKWFRETAEISHRKTIFNFKIDSVKIHDDF